MQLGYPYADGVHRPVHVPEYMFVIGTMNTADRSLGLVDLAWPAGIQEELSQPAAVLLNEEPATLALASAAGFRCFTTPAAFRAYVEQEILAVAA